MNRIGERVSRVGMVESFFKKRRGETVIRGQRVCKYSLLEILSYAYYFVRSVYFATQPQT